MSNRYQHKIDTNSNINVRTQHLSTNIQLRRIPYPYKAMLAICSDLDETPDRNVYWQIMRFLNTTEETAMGTGAGLEVGNSIYFDMPQSQFAYWNTDDSGREMIQALIRSGHIDCLHSYGDLAVKRQHVAKALEELDKNGCKLQVWVDHGTAPTNFGSDIMQGHGDEPGHEAYHADLTTDYGIKYIWRGRVTSIIGQDTPTKLGGIFEKRHPIVSGRTMVKETAKKFIGRSLNKKYFMHRSNQILQQVALRDGRNAYEFMRCNPHWRGVSYCDQGRHIEKVLTEEMLNRLITRGGICILYTHLGKIDNPKIPFSPEAVESFHKLQELHRNGKILVTTTRRLLTYNLIVHTINFDYTEDKISQCINITTDKNSIYRISESDLDGLTFYVPVPEATRMIIDGREVTDIQRNKPDHTGWPSISIPWPALEFPEV